MSTLRLRTASRLHFGLLAWSPASPRQFGGVGLMIERPGLDIIARPAELWQAEGPLARRVLQTAERVAERLAQSGAPAPTVRFQIPSAAPEHAGLGTGTQLGLAVARVLSELAGRHNLPVSALADLSERGLRSGIGLHGFAQGGLLVDGGKPTARPNAVPPLLARLAVPEDWAILVVLPPARPGLHGTTEVQAFAQLPPIPDAVTDHLCRLVLLDLLPATAERDLPRFAAALDELQQSVGLAFAPAQGGCLVRPELEPIVQFLRCQGVQGVGQSSWGPALYGFASEPHLALLSQLKEHFDLGAEAAFWTRASNHGALLEPANPA